MKKGFTIVELLAVIIIISILITITGISISKVVRNSKERLNEVQVNEIISATKAYISSHMGITLDTNECGYITLNKLKQEGLIEDIKNYKNKYVKVTVDSKAIIDYNYEIVDSIGSCVEI